MIRHDDSRGYKKNVTGMDEGKHSTKEPRKGGDMERKEAKQEPENEKKERKDQREKR